MGPVAEDFYHAFGLGIGETTIGLGDIDGVNFAAVKALDLRTQHVAQLEADNVALKASLADTQQRLARLEELVARLTAASAAPATTP